MGSKMGEIVRSSGGINEWRPKMAEEKKVEAVAEEQAPAQENVMEMVMHDENAPIITVRKLLEGGVHFGHHTRKWNPKMC